MFISILSFCHCFSSFCTSFNFCLLPFAPFRCRTAPPQCLISKLCFLLGALTCGISSLWIASYEKPLRQLVNANAMPNGVMFPFYALTHNKIKTHSLIYLNRLENEAKPSSHSLLLLRFGMRNVHTVCVQTMNNYYSSVHSIWCDAIWCVLTKTTKEMKWKTAAKEYVCVCFQIYTKQKAVSHCHALKISQFAISFHFKWWITWFFPCIHRPSWPKWTPKKEIEEEDEKKNDAMKMGLRLDLYMRTHNT